MGEAEENQEDPGEGNYPVQLGIAYLFLVGYLVRTLCVSLRLPASVGVIFTGFAFTFFFQTDLFYGRDMLQELAFFLVLLTAGLEINLSDLKPYMFVMAWLPATFELLAIAVYGKLMLEFTAIEGLVLGTVLVAIGDGLVIPKMKEFGMLFPGHPMPRLVFTWAPLEASFALALFGVLVGVSSPADQEVPSNVWILASVSGLRVVATLSTGALLGCLSGWLISKRDKATLNGQKLFTGAPVETFLLTLAVALVAFGLGAEEHGKELVPMIGSGGSLFQPELLVIVTGTSFAAVADPRVVHEVEGIMGGVWVFGQLILFSMLGSRTELTIFTRVLEVLPVMVVGLLARFLGVWVAVLSTLRARGCQSCSTVVPDVLFCFLSTLPRATVQGALGSVPVSQRFFKKWPNWRPANDFIFMAARLYIVCMSVIGMILLNTFGPRLLQDTSNYYMVGSDDDLELSEGGSPKAPSTESTGATADLASAIEVIASRYSVDPDRLLEILNVIGPQAPKGHQSGPSDTESMLLAVAAAPETPSPSRSTVPVARTRAWTDSAIARSTSKEVVAEYISQWTDDSALNQFESPTFRIAREVPTPDKDNRLPCIMENHITQQFETHALLKADDSRTQELGNKLLEAPCKPKWLPWRKVKTQEAQDLENGGTLPPL